MDNPGRLRGSRLSERGQVLVLVALMLPVLLGFTGLAVDYGRLTVEHRKLQNAVDAAALAAAIDLPSVSTTTANSTATSALSANGYAANSGGAASPAIVFSCTYTVCSPPPPNYDTVTVSGTRTVPLAILSVLKLFDPNAKTVQDVKATATAVRSGVGGCTFVTSANSICFPFAAWQPLQTCNLPSANPGVQVGDTITYLDQSWISNNNDNNYPDPNSHPFYPSNCGFTVPANDFKGYIRPVNGGPVTVTNPPTPIDILSHGGFANCGGINLVPGQIIVIPIVGAGQAGQGQGNPNITITGFVTIKVINYSCNGSQAWTGTVIAAPNSTAGLSFTACPPPSPTILALCIPTLTQ